MTPAAPLPDSTETRQALIDACLWMNERHINQGTSGNISARTQTGILITPSGVPYEDLTPDLMVTIPIEGHPAGTELKPSSEWPFHQALHQTRPDMPVVLHAHPPYCSVLAVQRRAIPACHYMIAAFGGTDVRCTEFTRYGTERLSALAIRGAPPRCAAPRRQGPALQHRSGAAAPARAAPPTMKLA